MRPYELVRSRRRTVRLEITQDGRVLVRAPLYAPKRQLDRFVAEKEDWIAAGLARQAQRRARHPEPTPEQEALWQRKAQQILPERVAYYGRRMHLTPTGVKITGARKRFGSCSARNSLCFSRYLMQYPPEAVDYVVVHELAHIVHKNHGKEFYALIESVLPDYRQRMALLKE